MSLLDLIAKIEKLPLERQTEVEDFVDFKELISLFPRRNPLNNTSADFH